MAIEHTRASVHAIMSSFGFGAACPPFADWNELAFLWKAWASADQFMDIDGKMYVPPRRITGQKRTPHV